MVGPVNPPSRGYIWILVDECDGDPLRFLGPKEAKWMIKEVHSGEYGEHQGKEKVVQMPTVNGLLLAYHEERHGKIYKKMLQLPSTG